MCLEESDNGWMVVVYKKTSEGTNLFIGGWLIQIIDWFVTACSMRLSKDRASISL